MTYQQSKVEQLISQLCPNGVAFKKLGELATIETGTQLNKTVMAEVGDYPVINGGINPSGNYYEYNTDKNTIAISQGGASAGYVNFIVTRFWAGAHCFVVRSTSNEIVNKYLFFLLKNGQKKLQNAKLGAGIPGLNKRELQGFKIPISPLAVQEEIVKILNKFTELEAKLEAELEARRMQYEYYRKQLLEPKDEKTEWVRLGDIAEYRRGSFPQPYGLSKWYDGEDAMPFVQVADVDEKMTLVDNTKRKISKLAQRMSVFVPAGTVLVTLQGSIGRVAITQYDCYVDRTLAIFEKFRININKKYFAYQLEKKFAIEKETARGSTIKTITKEEFTEFTIPVPSLEMQDKAVVMLDKFNALVNDISIGLPAELKARRQQYEYYRNKLLTFKELIKE